MTACRVKRILIVSHYYPPHLGGIETVARNQAEQLAAAGHDVTVVTSSVSADEVSGIVRGVRVVRVKAWNPLEKYAIPFPLFSPRLLPVLWRAAGEADIVHIHDVFYPSSFVAAISAAWRKRPIVLTQHVATVPHSSAVNLLERLVYATTGTYIFHRANRVTTLNDRVEAFVRRHGVPAAKLTFLPNGTDCRSFHPASSAEKRAARRKFALPQDKPIVLFVGRAVPKKGFDKVLAAQSGDYLIVFAGNPLKRRATSRAKFLGMAPPAEMAQIFRTADLYVLPSEGEGFPLTVQEAMASGLPVVLRDDPGYGRYNLTAETVCLLSDPDPAAIKTALQELLNDAPRREQLGRRARAYAEAHFSWDTLVQSMERLYDEVLAAPGSAS